MEEIKQNNNKKRDKLTSLLLLFTEGVFSKVITMKYMIFSVKHSPFGKGPSKDIAPSFNF